MWVEVDVGEGGRMCAWKRTDVCVEGEGCGRGRRMIWVWEDVDVEEGRFEFGRVCAQAFLRGVHVQGNRRQML